MVEGGETMELAVVLAFFVCGALFGWLLCGYWTNKMIEKQENLWNRVKK